MKRVNKTEILIGLEKDHVCEKCGKLLTLQARILPPL